MNEYLYNYMGSQGATAITLPDRIKEYLEAEIAAGGGSTTGEETIDDLWQILANVESMASTTTNEIQMEWALSRGSSGTTWNDLMRNLP